MYVQDYDDCYAQACLDYPGHYSATYSYWQEMVQPYMKNWNILYCPNERPTVVTSRLTGGEIPYVIWGGVAYSVNQGFGYRNASGITVNEAMIDRPADIIYVAECQIYTTYPFWWTYGSGYYFLRPRHNEGLNCCFADGHAKWLRLEDAEKREHWCFPGQLWEDRCRG